jgi:hypothetical protein
VFTWLLGAISAFECFFDLLSGLLEVRLSSFTTSLTGERSITDVLPQDFLRLPTYLTALVLYLVLFTHVVSSPIARVAFAVWLPISLGIERTSLCCPHRYKHTPDEVVLLVYDLGMCRYPGKPG